MLNASTIGGKKGDRWRDDIWTMKYLSGFKWEMLGEQVGEYLLHPFISRPMAISPLTVPAMVAYERQAHSARLRQELSKSRAEQSEYLRNVELARVLEKRKAKKQAQTGDQGGQSSSSVTTVPNDKAQRVYKQKTLVGKGQGGKKASSSAGEARTGNSGGRADAMAGVLDDLF
jgi:ESF2/ABP1 family protein